MHVDETVYAAYVETLHLPSMGARFKFAEVVGTIASEFSRKKAVRVFCELQCDLVGMILPVCRKVRPQEWGCALFRRET